MKEKNDSQGYDELLESWLNAVLECLEPEFVEEKGDFRRYHCPFHRPDKNPSFVVNVRKKYGFDYHNGQKYNLKELALALNIKLPRVHKKGDYVET